MCRAGLTLFALLAAAPAVFPQAPPADPPQIPAALGTHLTAWEARNKQVKTLSAACELVKRDTVHRKEKVYTGTLTCMKPNLARLTLAAKTAPADSVAYLCDGASVYEYDGPGKRVTEHRLPAANPNGAADNLLLAFLSGSMTAADAVKRFDLSLVKEEEYYVYIGVKPRLPRDLQEFESATLVLYGPKAARLGLDYLPAVVVLRGNTGQTEEQWTLSRLEPNSDKVTADKFRFAKPEGWELIPARGAALPQPGVAPRAGLPVSK